MTEIKENREIWVFIETACGSIIKSSLELFTPALEIAAKTGGTVTGVILGSDVTEAANTLGAYGADRVIAVEAGEYSADRFTDIMAALVEKYRPDSLMLSATANAKDFASKLACRIKTGVTANCTELSVEPDSGLISWMMPAPGGVIATILCEKTRPQMGTVCPGIFKRPAAVPGESVPVIMEVPEAADIARVVRLAVETIVEEKCIEDAEIIVAGGYGVGKDGFALLEQLANALGGVVGASRAAVDAEWVTADRMVGQSGKVVHPRLYIACGISGALQHIVGVGADCVVAINTDKNAPIFNIADYGIVGPVEKIIPALVAEVERVKS